jgi:Na+/proline symporter
VAIAALFILLMLIVTVLFSCWPDMEKHRDEVRREASAAGLLVAVLFMLLACVTIIVGFTLLPVMQSAPQPSVTLPESSSD